MPDITPKWRPRAEIRPIAIGLIHRKADILVAAVTEDDGRIKGWRPLGGGIEFGECAEDALRREIKEELAAKLGPTEQITVLENFFEHHGALGHEIVFVLRAQLTEPGRANSDRFIMEDGGHRAEVAWVDRDKFLSGQEKLLPEGLIAHL